MAVFDDVSLGSSAAEFLGLVLCVHRRSGKDWHQEIDMESVWEKVFKSWEWSITLGDGSRPPTHTRMVQWVGFCIISTFFLRFSVTRQPCLQASNQRNGPGHDIS